MSYHSRESFLSMSADLGATLQVTAARFCSSAGLKFDHPGLDQMTVSFADIAKEALMFGANAWPDTIEADTLPCPQVVRSMILSPLFSEPTI